MGNPMGRNWEREMQPAPGWSLWIDNHFHITGHITVNIPITCSTIVLPTASNINQVELALRPPTSCHIQCDDNCEIWRDWHLHVWELGTIWSSSCSTWAVSWMTVTVWIEMAPSNHIEKIICRFYLQFMTRKFNRIHNSLVLQLNF